MTNFDLKKLMDLEGDELTLSRFYTLRRVVMLILIVVNILSLYVIKRFKARHPRKLGVSNFSLLFKNLKKTRIDGLLAHLRS